MNANAIVLPLVVAAAVSAVSPSAPPIACNPSAIPAAERARHAALTDKLFGAVVSREDLMSGYAFTVAPSRMTLAELSEWAGLEAKCCPFLEFGFDFADGAVSLRLTGRPEAKAFVEEMVPQGKAATLPGYVGKRIHVRFDDGAEMVVDYPAPGRIHWVGLAGRCKGEDDGAAIEASEIVPGVWLFGWTEGAEGVIDQIVDWRAGTILSHTTSRDGGTMRMRVRRGVFDAAGAELVSDRTDLGTSSVRPH